MHLFAHEQPTTAMLCLPCGKNTENLNNCCVFYSLIAMVIVEGERCKWLSQNGTLRHLVKAV
jgi:hypothetical protein